MSRRTLSNVWVVRQTSRWRRKYLLQHRNDKNVIDFHRRSGLDGKAGFTVQHISNVQHLEHPSKKQLQEEARVAIPQRPLKQNKNNDNKDKD